MPLTLTPWCVSTARASAGSCQPGTAAQNSTAVGVHVGNSPAAGAECVEGVCKRTVLGPLHRLPPQEGAGQHSSGEPGRLCIVAGAGRAGRAQAAAACCCRPQHTQLPFVLQVSLCAAAANHTARAPTHPPTQTLTCQPAYPHGLIQQRPAGSQGPLGSNLNSPAWRDVTSLQSDGSGTTALLRLPPLMRSCLQR